MNSLSESIASLRAENATLRERLERQDRLAQELQAARAALAASEHRYDQIFNHNQSIQLLIDPDTWAIADANAAACRFYGYGHAELTSLSLAEISVHSLAETRERLERGRANGQDRYEFRHRLRSGELRDMEVYVAPLESAGRRLLFCNLHDVTLMKQALIDAERQRDYLAALYDTTVTLMADVDVASFLRTMLGQASALVGCESGAIYLADEDGAPGPATLKLAVALPGDDSLPAVVRPGEGAAGQAWQTGATVFVDQFWEPREPVDETGRLQVALVQSTLAVPLVVGDSPGALAGVIVLGYRRAEARFGHDQVGLLNQFARLASLALQQRQLYDAARRELAERQRAEIELRRLNERFQLAEMAASGGIYDWDIQADTLTLSEGFCRQFGHADVPSGADLAWWEALVHPGDRDLFAEALAAALEHSDVFSATYRLRSHEGAYRYVYDWSSVIRDERGQPWRLVGSVVDMTERYAAEQALRESEERYRRLVEMSPDAIGLVVEDRVIYANPAALRLFGARSPADLIGRSAFDFVPSDRKGYGFALSPDGPVYATDLEFIRVDGQSLLIELAAVPISYQGRSGFQIVSRDITERRRAERALRESEERYRRLVELAPIPIVVYRGDRILYANVQAAALARVPSRDDLIGASMLSFVPADDRERAEQVLASGGGAPVTNAEFEFIAADGTPTMIEVSTSAIMYEGAPARQVIATDITGRRQAEAQRLLLERRLLEAQKMQSLAILAGGIAHDFNNLLVAMLGNAHLALLELPPDSPSRGTIEEIEQAAQRATELTRQMLAYAGRGAFMPQPIDLNALLCEVVRLVPVSELEQPQIEYHLHPHLSPVQADQTQLRHVILSVVINAMEALADRPNRRLQVTSGESWIDPAELPDWYAATPFAARRYVFFEVVDTGIGMDASTLRKMFDPFFSTKFTGRGLGLAATLGIVKGHGGGILVRSLLGIGTAVKVLLPATVQSTDQPDPAPAARKNAGAGNGQILVIDDDPEVRVVTERILLRLGYAVLLAKDGREGVALFRQHADQISGVLLDLTMPGFDGTATFHALREISQSVKVIVMSGYNEQDLSQDLRQHGLVGFLSKPFLIDDLRTQLAALGRSG